MLDKAEMYNFWSLYSRKIIGKRIERIIWLEVFAAYFVPNIRAEPCFKECFALCTLTLTVCLSSSVQQAISHDMFPSAPNSHPVRRRILVCHVYCRLEAEWSCNQALFWPFAFIAGCICPHLSLFHHPAYLSWCTRTGIWKLDAKGGGEGMVGTVSFSRSTRLELFHLQTTQRLRSNSSFLARSSRVGMWFLARYEWYNSVVNNSCDIWNFFMYEDLFKPNFCIW